MNRYYYPNIEGQIIELINRVEIPPYKVNNNVDDLNDFKDGKIYRALLNSEDGKFFKNSEAFSFIMNTDGISPCSKSKLTIWPIYLTIGEIPLDNRFLIENTILAGNLILIQ